jgi:deoxyribonuclease IV
MPRKKAVHHPIGAHVPVGGGLVKRGIPNAIEFDVEALQVFIGSPRGWAPPRLETAVAEAFRDECAERGWPVYLHAAYLLNLASPVPETVERSVENLRVAMTSAERIGAAGVVVHAGSSIDGDRDAALRRLPSAFHAVLDDAPPVRLLVEPTAGGANSMASTLASAGEYLEAVGIPEVGLCLDTCHLHAAGERLSDRDGLEASLKALGKDVGSDRVGLIHFNDSKDACDSRRDRHEALGEGQLGDDGLKAVMASPALAGVPLIVETATQARDVAHAKRLLAEVQSERS